MIRKTLIFLAFGWMPHGFAQTSTVNYVHSIAYPNGLENPAVSGLAAGELPNNTALQNIGYFNGWAQGIQSRTLVDGTGNTVISRNYFDMRGRSLVLAKPVLGTGGLQYQALGMSSYLGGFSGGQDSTFERMVWAREVGDRLLQKMPFGTVYHNAARAIKQEFAYDQAWKAMRNRSIDEDGNIADAYIDRNGRTIMQVNRMSTAPQDLTTLFYYDGSGNLIESISPLGVGSATAVPFSEEITMPFGTYNDGGGCEYLPGYASTDSILLGLEPQNNPNHPVIRYYRPAHSVSATVTISHRVHTPGCSYQLNLQYRINKTGCWQSIGSTDVTLNLGPTEEIVEVRREKLITTSTGCSEPVIKVKVEATAMVIDAKYVTTYKYDTMNRLIEKTSADEGLSYFVYDDMGRLRLFQDQNRRNKVSYQGLVSSEARWMYMKYDEAGRIIRQGEVTTGAGDRTWEEMYNSVRYEANVTTLTPLPFNNQINESIPSNATSQIVTLNLPANVINGSATIQITNDSSCDVMGYADSLHAVGPGGGGDGGGGTIQCTVGVNCPCCNVTYSVKYWFEPGGSDSSNFQTLSGGGPHNIALQANKVTLKVKVYNISQTVPQGYSGCDKVVLDVAVSASGQYNQVDVTASTRVYNGVNSYPTANTTDLVWNYYDAYTFTGAPANNLALPGSYSNYPKGRLTKRIIRDPNENSYTEELFFYDKYGRVVTKMVYLAEVGTKRIDYWYDASGRLLKLAYQSGQPDAFYQWYEYDNLSRLQKTYSSRMNDKSSAVKETEYAYDNINGKIKQLILGNNVQTVDYTYTVRDWLKTINDVNSLGSDKFAMTLSYDDGAAGSATVARYNGNIRSQKWIVSGQTAQGYDYTYDQANRLIDANFQDQNKYSEKTIGYDYNGNIKNLTRHLNSPSGSTINYTYDANKPNQLIAVGGGLTASYTYDGNGNMTYDQTKGTLAYDWRNLPLKVDLSSGNDVFFSYDGSGQRIRKLLKNGSTVQADSRIYIRGANDQVVAEYKYDGSAWKTDHFNLYGAGLVGKLTGDWTIVNINGQTISASQSADSMTIGNSTIQAGINVTLQATGGLRVTATFNSNGATVLLKAGATGGGGGGTTSQRYYYLADHLGSIRVTLDQNGNIDSWTDYYPFGKEARGSATSNRPKEQFTGKERDTEIGLDYFGARYYNADIGRWVSVDPNASEYAWVTPYNYSLNNPIYFLDPDGRDVKGHSETLFNTQVAVADVVSPAVGGMLHTVQPRHSYLRVTTDKVDLTIELGGPQGDQTTGNVLVEKSSDFARPGEEEHEVTGPMGSKNNYAMENKIIEVATLFKKHSDLLPKYAPLGPNSNGFAQFLVQLAGGKIDLPQTAYGKDTGIETYQKIYEEILKREEAEKKKRESDNASDAQKEKKEQ